jgi:hypothetical protein
MTARAIVALVFVAAILALMGASPQAAAGTDSDGDGFDDDIELYLGTDPYDACPDDPTDDAWPPDVAGGEGCGSHDGKVNILDILCFKPPLFGPCDARYDLNGDGLANLLDVVLLKPFINTSCTNP